MPEKVTAERFIEFAKQDLRQNDERGVVNSYSNLKRAMHCIVDDILNHFDLTHPKIKKSNFYEKIELIRKLGLMLPESFKIMNESRNLLEHEYIIPNKNEVIIGLDLVESFLRDAKITLSGIIKYSDKWKEHLSQISESELPDYNDKKIEVEISATKTTDSKLDLSNYPSMFIENGRFRGLLVVGDKAPAEHVVAISDIISSLQFAATKKVGDQIQANRISVSSAVLSSEVKDLNTNIICVGDPSVNPIIAKIMGKDIKNYTSIGQFTFLIKLYDLGNGNVALIALSHSPEAIRAAGNVIANYKSYKLEGQEMIMAQVRIKATSC